MSNECTATAAPPGRRRQTCSEGKAAPRLSRPGAHGGAASDNAAGIRHIPGGKDWRTPSVRRADESAPRTSAVAQPRSWCALLPIGDTNTKQIRNQNAVGAISRDGVFGGFTCVGQVVIGLHRSETQKLRLGGFGVDHRNDLYVAFKPADGDDLRKIRTSSENDAGKPTCPGEFDDC